MPQAGWTVDELQRLAAHRGLSYEYSPGVGCHFLTGVVNDRRVRVELAAVVDQGWGGEFPAGRGRVVAWALPEVRVPIWPALDLGLELRARGPRTVATGDAAFDEAYCVCGDEDSRILALLTPAIRATLIAFAGNARVDDKWLQLACPASDVPSIDRGLEDGLRLGAAFEAQRLLVPPASPLAAHAAAWRDFAAKRGLRAWASPLALEGRVDAVEVRAYASRVGPLRYAIEVSVPFETPLGLGLRVRRAKSGIAALFAHADVATGDAAFDDAFEVEARDPRIVPEVLDAETRALALEPRSDAEVIELADDAVRLRARADSLDPSDIPRLVDAANRMVAACRRGASRGAYR